MTLLVLGNAALLDLILKAPRRPGNSDFGVLEESPGSEGVWSEGGAALTIALAARRMGAPTLLWHPLPVQDEGTDLQNLAAEGVDIGLCPRLDQAPVRSLMVYGNDWRLGWSAPPLDARFEAPPDTQKIASLIIAPVWGGWTDAALDWARHKGIPATLVGFADRRAEKYAWDRIIVDEQQAADLVGTDAREWIITDGAKGARRVVGGQTHSRIDPVLANAIDTTGAGDTFAGTYLGALHCGLPSARAGALAATRAARVCETWGSRPQKEFFETTQKDIE